MEIPTTLKAVTVVYQQETLFPEATCHLTKYYSDGFWSWRQPDLEDFHAPHLSLEAEGSRLAEVQEARHVSEDMMRSPSQDGAITGSQSVTGLGSVADIDENVADTESYSVDESHEPLSISTGIVNDILSGGFDSNSSDASSQSSICYDINNPTRQPLFGGADYHPEDFPYWSIRHDGKALPPEHSLPSQAYTDTQKKLNEYERRKTSGEELFSDREEEEKGGDSNDEHVFYNNIIGDSEDGYDSASTGTTNDEWDAEDSDEDFVFSPSSKAVAASIPGVTFNRGGIVVEGHAAGRGKKGAPATHLCSRAAYMSPTAIKALSKTQSKATSTKSDKAATLANTGSPVVHTEKKRKRATENVYEYNANYLPGPSIKRQKVAKKTVVDNNDSSDDEDVDEYVDDATDEEEEEENLYNDDYLPKKARARKSAGKKSAHFKSSQKKDEKKVPEYLPGPFPDDGFDYVSFNMWDNMPQVQTSCMWLFDLEKDRSCIKQKKAGKCCYIGTPQVPRPIFLYYQRDMIRRKVHGDYTITEEDFEHGE
ncbi:hypothetical protein IAR50_003107 [Cryptococcus sp. DSM 104548]